LVFCTVIMTGGSNMDVWPGKPYPLGATYDGMGTNFSIFSEVAEKVELCLFDEEGKETRVELPEMTAFCWHGFLHGVAPGQRYGYRVYGEWAPDRGLRCNGAKLLIDPYAKALQGGVKWDPAVFGYTLGESDEIRDDRDSSSFMPKSVVINPFFDWGNDAPIKRPLSDTLIYEVHVKGFSKRHPDIPEDIQGTYSALAHPASVEYFQKLGVSALELMPVHQFIHDAHLVEKGLRNYWGYNTIGFFAPHNEYAAYGQTGQQVQEFKQMVKTLHEADIEVILDVVYNHTAEGNHMGPMLSFRGIDNGAYYRLNTEDPRYYVDYTGTGNSLNMRHPHVLQLIMDSLRYWVTEMHVDGFRFDLASTLARELHDVDRLSAFFDLVQQDPVVSQVKLIAEPWDVGEGGYQVGNFPPLWSEWNGKYRDCMRDFWRGQDQTLGEFAYRFTGSSDLYANTGRRPFASINFVTAHDGFTLHDLVSYNEKHNEANGEGNADGADDNRSWNCGVEGPTDDAGINVLRRRQKMNFLVSLMCSQGIPMLLGGDEIGRTQQGNNNAYCQDNEISWFDWDHIDEQLLEFVRHLVRLRWDHPVFRRRRWFMGRAINGSDLHDIGWFAPDGKLMTHENWRQDFAKSLMVFLNGEAIPSSDFWGRKVMDDSFLFLVNAHYEPLEFTLPDPLWGDEWKWVLDTGRGGFLEEEQLVRGGSGVQIESRAIAVLMKRMKE